MTASPILHQGVVLLRDVPAEGLKQGDLGTVVHAYRGDVLSGDSGEAQGYEVEFFTALGKTRAVLTLRAEDVRAIAESDILSVRSPAPAAG